METTRPPYKGKRARRLREKLRLITPAALAQIQGAANAGHKPQPNRHMRRMITKLQELLKRAEAAWDRGHS